MSMKAVVVHESGDSTKLCYEDVAIPTLEDGEVLVKNHCSGVNFLDIYMRRSGKGLPKILGFEGSGVVDKLGPGVTGVKTGDRVVYCQVGIGTYAQYSKIPAKRLVHVPEGLSLDQACSSFVQGMTAHYLVTEMYKPGDSVLVHAAAGGTGALVCQVAKNSGAFVIGTCSTEDKADIARAAGADEVILYTQKDFVEETLRITSQKGVQIIYDSVGKDTLHRGLNCLAPKGTLVSYGSSSGTADPIPASTLEKKSHSFVKPGLFNYIMKEEDLHRRSSDVFRWVMGGTVKLSEPKIIPLSDAKCAHDIMESRGTRGKILLQTN